MTLYPKITVESFGAHQDMKIIAPSLLWPTQQVLQGMLPTRKSFHMHQLHIW